MNRYTLYAMDLNESTPSATKSITFGSFVKIMIFCIGFIVAGMGIKFFFEVNGSDTARSLAFIFYGFFFVLPGLGLMASGSSGFDKENV